MHTETMMKELYRVISSRFKDQSGIIYCLTQRDTEDVASQLCQLGLRASCYHANMDATSRSRVHADWSSNKLQVMCDTVFTKISHLLVDSIIFSS